MRIEFTHRGAASCSGQGEKGLSVAGKEGTVKSSSSLEKQVRVKGDCTLEVSPGEGRIGGTWRDPGTAESDQEEGKCQQKKQTSLPGSWTVRGGRDSLQRRRAAGEQEERIYF